MTFEAVLMTALITLGVERPENVDVTRMSRNFNPGATAAYSYEGREGHLTVNVDPDADNTATEEERLHVARHEACHLKLHEKAVRDPNRVTPQQRARMELEAEDCVVRRFAGQPQ